MSAGGFAAASLALVFNAFVWGLSWWPFRLLDERGLHPLWASCLISALCALAVLAAHRGVPQLPAEHRGGLLALGLACGATNAAFNWGITIGEVVRVVLLFYLMPVWSLLAARFLLHEPIHPRGILQMLLALIGALLVLWKPDPLAQPSGGPVGGPDMVDVGHFAGIDWLRDPADWLGLIGGVAFALTNVLLRRHREAPSASRAMAMFAGGALVPAVIALQPLHAVADVPTLSWHWGAPLLALALAFLAANLALQSGAARLPARLTALIMLSELVFAVGSAVWIGDETLRMITVLGASMILAATLWGLVDVQGRPSASFPQPDADPPSRA